MMIKQIPVLLITGYLGSGKTTLLNRILNNKRGIKFAVIVNDIGEVNIDANLIEQGGVVGKKDDSLVALQNGCICCTLKMDLVEQLHDITCMDKFDYIAIEASGIALATICAQKYGVPMLFAKKAKSDNIEGGLYQSEVFSYTYKKKVTLIVSHEWLHADDHVLIIDDFMAKGYAMQGLVDLVNAAGATLEGIGVAVEKGFQGGGDKFRASGVPYKALAVIEQADENGILFREDD